MRGLGDRGDGDRAATEPRTKEADQALTSTDGISLERLQWIIRLHWIAGTVLYVLTLVQWFIAPLESGPLLSTILIGTVYAYTLVAMLAVRRWQKTHHPEMPAFSRRLLNALCAADIGILSASTHLFGSPDNPGLAFFIVPLIVFGCFLPRADAFLQASASVTLLGFLFLGEHLGWLPHVCPPIDGYGCSIPSAEFVTMRYLAVVFLAFVVTYLTTFIGNSLREQEASARRFAQEQAELAELKGQFVAMASHELRTPLATILAASDVLTRYYERLRPEDRELRLTKIRSAVQREISLTSTEGVGTTVVVELPAVAPSGTSEELAELTDALGRTPASASTSPRLRLRRRPSAAATRA